MSGTLMIEPTWASEDLKRFLAQVRKCPEDAELWMRMFPKTREWVEHWLRVKYEND